MPHSTRRPMRSRFSCGMTLIMSAACMPLRPVCNLCARYASCAALMSIMSQRPPSANMSACRPSSTRSGAYRACGRVSAALRHGGAARGRRSRTSSQLSFLAQSCGLSRSF